MTITVPTAPDFMTWLAKQFGQDISQIEILMQDATAMRFLITWSIFEIECFGKKMVKSKIALYSKRLTKSQQFSRNDFDSYLKHFHQKYKNKKLFGHLIYGDKGKEVERAKKILEETLTKVDDEDAMLFLIYVVFRFRNNIFHGNKKVLAWLSYTEQIEYCSEIMQRLVDLNAKLKS